MADIPTGQPAAAQPATAPSFVPGEHDPTAVSDRPYTGVEPNSAAGVTPADADRQQARTQLKELEADPQWSKRLLDHWNKPGSPERAEFEALIKRIDGQPATPPPPEPTEAERAMAALEPPERVEDYKLVDYGGREIKLDAENEAIVRGEILPIAHALGLSQSDIEMAIYGVMKPMTFQECEAHLQRSWGANFETNLDLFHAAISALPPALYSKALELIQRFPELLSNNAFAMKPVVAARLRRQGKR